MDPDQTAPMNGKSIHLVLMCFKGLYSGFKDR